METFIQNQPNPIKLFDSLRNAGYDNYTALEDLLDNSIDAEATKIDVIAENKDGEYRILVIDNGNGMDAQTLEEAIKLGSNTTKEGGSLGKYGMGLITASISIARKLEIITRNASGNTLYCCQDLDEIERLDGFLVSLREARAHEKVIFDKHVGQDSTGTIIILTKLDRLSDSNLSQFGKTLQSGVARKFRRFLMKGRKISINFYPVHIDDPLMLSHPETRLYSEDECIIPADITGKKSKVQVKIAILPEMSQERMKDLKINMRNQGIYLMRNDREIASGKTLELFTKHNDFNRMRIEISFTDELDQAFNVIFNKANTSNKIAENVGNILSEHLSGQIKTIRSILKLNQSSTDSDDIGVVHTDSQEVIIKNLPKQVRPLPTESDPYYSDLAPKSELPVRFEDRSMGRESILFESGQEGKTVIVRWNTDHPFYEKMIKGRREDKDLISSLDFLIYSLACAELKTMNDENEEVLANIKIIMSANLRALMSGI